MKKKLKKLLKKLPRPRLPSKRQVLVAAVAALIAFGGSKAYQSQSQAYSLTIFANTIGGPQPLEQIAVDHVSHENDGSICFRMVKDSARGCVKVELYILKPAE